MCLKLLRALLQRCIKRQQAFLYGFIKARNACIDFLQFSRQMLAACILCRACRALTCSQLAEHDPDPARREYLVGQRGENDLLREFPAEVTGVAATHTDAHSRGALVVAIAAAFSRRLCHAGAAVPAL